ncbi:hypothetical protein [Acidithiobacillus ferrivorans]|uniref:hypothetical protein n=2 Tax=Acidithiobacillus ferrivorans TaxID=160808 RepID=UPI0018E5A2EB|nr:hypothetical protein [Acidithiobacillus ferrivorans]MBN6740122.1 hypothetical protein [Acidithiobacillus sp. MC6.1]
MESTLANMFLASIQGKDIAEYRDTILADGYSPITVRRRLSLLSHMQVAAITGHKTLQMLKRYPHLRAEDLVKMLG